MVEAYAILEMHERTSGKHRKIGPPGAAGGRGGVDQFHDGGRGPSGPGKPGRGRKDDHSKNRG